MIRQKFNALKAKIRDTHTEPYESFRTSFLHRTARTWRYKFAGRGIGFLLNERKILKYKNAYKGKRVFIIGNGPSLNELDLTKLKDEVTIGFNSIFLAEKDMGFAPTHYVVEDLFVAEDRADRINAYVGPEQKWFGNYLRHCLKKDMKTVWLNVRMRYDNYPSFPYFSPNAARQVWTGGTVSFIGMQLAYYFGAKEVYLIGFDHSYDIPDDADVEGLAITSNSDDPNHFHPDYFGKGFRWHDPLLERMEQAYAKTRTYYEQNGRSIKNATAGGKLEVFERVDYESLF